MKPTASAGGFPSRMFRLLLLVALLECLPHVRARAEERPRYISPTGTTYVLRIQTERTRDGVRIDGDEREIERTVTESDGIGGVIANKILDIRGGFVDQLSPDEKQVYLSVLSSDFSQSAHYMIPTRSSYVAWPLNNATVHLPPMRMITSFVIDVSCDEATLETFFPIGRLQRAVVPCEVGVRSNGAARPSDHLQMTLRDDGAATAETPAGSFAVRKVTATQDYGSGPKIVQTSMFSVALGLAVLTDSVSESKSGASVLRVVEHRELLRIATPAQ